MMSDVIAVVMAKVFIVVVFLMGMSALIHDVYTGALP